MDESDDDEDPPAVVCGGARGDGGVVGDDIIGPLIEVLVDVAAASGLGDGVGAPPDEGDVGVDDPSVALPAAPPPDPWSLFSEPSMLGYVYSEGRSVVRIQRPEDQPTRCWINCYSHPSCRANVMNRDGSPTNLEIFEWMYSVERATPLMTGEQRKALAQRHMQSARDKWGARRR